MHLDIDAFFASVEQLRNPTLRGKPVAVGSGVIASCSYEARRFGLANGMPLARAERLCPSLAIVRGHYAVYRSFAARVFELCAAWSPVVESHLDEAYLDLGGTGLLYPDPLAVGRALKGEIGGDIGLRVTVGLGRNRMFARLIGARGKPDGLRRLDEAEEEPFLVALPIRALPGIGTARAALLERLQVSTVGDLRRLSRRALVALLGLDGATLHERAHGEDHRAIGDRTIGDREVPRSILRSTSFEEETEDPRRIDGMLEYLVERAARALRGRGLVAGGIAVAVGFADHRRDARSRRLPSPTALDPELVREALALRRALAGRRVALRFIGVTLDRLRLAPEALQLELFADPPPLADAAGGRAAAEEIAEAAPPVDRDRWTRLLASLDRIRDRHGDGAVLSGGALRWADTLARDRGGLVLRTSSLTR